jgi:hypothetical protein
MADGEKNTFKNNKNEGVKYLNKTHIGLSYVENI